MKSIRACEGGSLEIKCDVGKEIVVVDANFGRTSRNVCNENNKPFPNCISRRSRIIITEACMLEQRCTLSASISVFGDHCPGVRKYLEVDYACRRKKNDD